MFRSNFSRLVTPANGRALEVIFAEGGKNIVTHKSSLFNVEGTDDPYKQSLGLVGLGLLKPMPEGSRIRMDKMRQGRARVYLGDVFNVAVGYTRQMQRADPNKTILKLIAKELKKAFVQTQEIAASLRWLNGFTFQGDEPDQVAWFSTAHKLLRSVDGSTVWSNRSSTDASLSYTSLRQASVDLELTKSDSGRVDPLIPKDLLIGPVNRPLAYELTKSTLVPGATVTPTAGVYQQQNTVNFVNGGMGLTPMVNEYWGSSTAWFLTTGISDLDFHWYNFMSDVYDNYMDFHTKIYYQDVSAEWGYGAGSTRGAYGSAGIA